MNTLYNALEPFFSQFKLRKYRKGDNILHEDDTPNGIYLIKSGYVRLYSYSPEGDELTRTILGPQDLFPIRWFFAKEPINYYLEPIKDVEAWYAPKELFLTYINADPQLLFNLSAYMAHRMGTLYKRMEYFAFGDAYNKVATILTALAKHFGVEKDGNIVIDVPLTQTDIASFVGVARETVNMEMEKLVEKEIIGHKNHTVWVKNMKLLEKESQPDAEI